MSRNSTDKEFKSVHKNNKSSKTVTSSSSLINLADNSTLKQAAKNKLRKEKKATWTVATNHPPMQTASEVFCLNRLIMP